MMFDLKDEKEAKEYLDNIHVEYGFQCHKEKSPEGCHRLATFLEAVRTDQVEAARIFKMNCDEYHYGHSCYKYGNYAIFGEGMEKNLDEGMKYHEKGCKNGFIGSCHNVGLLHINKGGKFYDPKKALEVFKRTCDLGHSFSCDQISAMYITGTRGPPRDMMKAYHYSKKACDLGHKVACANVSIMYREGSGVGKDQKLAQEFRKKAEDLQEQELKSTVKSKE